MKILEQLKEKLADKIVKIEQPNKTRLYITVDRKDLSEAVQAVFSGLGGRYVIASAVDNFDNFEILYHFAFDRENVMVSLRVFLEREKPEVESFAALIPGIAYIEREMWELFGINFLNHPNLKHFLLPVDWPEGNYPLRKANG